MMGDKRPEIAVTTINKLEKGGGTGAENANVINHKAGPDAFSLSDSHWYSKFRRLILFTRA